MASTYIDQAIEKLKEFEGSVAWMYLDTVGKVTVGVGLMLPTGQSADALPFTIGDRAATPAEIAEEFGRVSGLAKGKPAKFYARTGGVRLSQQTIEQKLRETLEGFEGYLRKHIAGYDLLPDAAKLALLDMVYNLGPGKLFAEYPRLIKAIEAGDWKTAAGASSRRGPGPARNLWTQEQFTRAAQAVVTEIRAAMSSAVAHWVLVAFTAAAAALVAIFVYEESERQS